MFSTLKFIASQFCYLFLIYVVSKGKVEKGIYVTTLYWQNFIRIFHLLVAKEINFYMKPFML